MPVRPLFASIVTALALCASATAVRGQQWTVLPNVQIESCTPDGKVATGFVNVGGGDFHLIRFTPDGGIEDLGVMAGGTKSGGMALSENGNVIVGVADDGVDDRAFRWTSGGGVLHDLGTLGGPTATPYHVSADGQVVVGFAAVNAVDAHAFVWSPGMGMMDLGTLGGNLSAASRVSDDGTTVLGMSDDAGGNTRTFVWTADGGMQDIGDFGGPETFPAGLSADGSTVVGFAFDGGGDAVAYRWTEAGGLEDLGNLGQPGAIAFCTSENGDVVAGYAATASGARAYRWTDEDGMQSLGAFGGDSSIAQHISANGEYIAGNAQELDGTWEAYLWRPEHNKKRLKWIVEQTTGENLDDYRIDSVKAMSRDGRKMYLSVERPDGTMRDYYFAIGPRKRISKDRWQTPYIASETQATHDYAYYAYLYGATDASYYAYVYADYARVYDDAAKKLRSDYYDKNQKTNAYLDLRYNQYQMIYSAFVYSYYYGAQTGAPYAAETANSANAALAYLAYEFE